MAWNITLSNASGAISVGDITLNVEQSHGPTVLIPRTDGVMTSGHTNGNKYVWKVDNSGHYPQGTKLAGLRCYTSTGMALDYYPNEVIDLEDTFTSAEPLELYVLTWIGNRFEDGITQRFNEASKMEIPHDLLRTAHIQPVRFSCENVQYVCMKTTYDSDDEVWTLYYRRDNGEDVRVAECSISAEEFIWVNDKYRTIQFNHQRENYADEVLLTNYVMNNTTDITEWCGLVIMSNDGSSSLYHEPHLYVNNYKGYPPITVVADGIINSNTKEYIYKYTGHKLFQGVSFVCETVEPELRIGDEYDVSGSLRLYIVESEFQHYIIGSHTLKDIADAIRSQNGKEDPIIVTDFAKEIRGISGTEQGGSGDGCDCEPIEFATDTDIEELFH